MFVALASSVLAFTFAAGEAGAEQLSRAPQQPAKVTDGEAADSVAGKPADKVSPNGVVPVEKVPAVAVPIKTPAEETVPVEALPVEALPEEAPSGEGFAPRVPDPASRQELAVQPGLVAQPQPVVGGQPGRYSSGMVLEPTPPATGFAAEPMDEARLEAEPVSSGAGALLPTGEIAEPDAVPEVALVQEPASGPELAPPAFETVPEPVVPDLGEELYVSASLADPVGGAVEIIEGAAVEGAAANDPGMLGGGAFRPASVDGGLFDTAFAGPFPGTEAAQAPEKSGLTEDPGAALAGPTGPSESPLTESPLKDAPRPVSPFTPPPGGSSFSLSGSSAFGLGSLALLLFCVLATGPIVLRQDSKLVLALRELPKPNSALKLPLERPG